MTTTRSPTFTRPGWATSTTSPAASWPRKAAGAPSTKALYSVHMGATCTLTTAQSATAWGRGTSHHLRPPRPHYRRFQHRLVPLP